MYLLNTDVCKMCKEYCTTTSYFIILHHYIYCTTTSYFIILHHILFPPPFILSTKTPIMRHILKMDINNPLTINWIFLLLTIVVVRLFAVTPPPLARRLKKSTQLYDQKEPSTLHSLVQERNTTQNGVLV